MKFNSLILALFLTGEILGQRAYIGGNDPNFLENNPAFINKFLEHTKGTLDEACKQIPGVGSAVLSINQIQQSISNLLDSTNPESYAKIIFFKEFANARTKQLIYKTVVMIKTFNGVTYVGIESLYKPQGYPSFELLAYVVDSDLKTIKKVLKDNSISPNDIFACGDIK